MSMVATDGDVPPQQPLALSHMTALIPLVVLVKSPQSTALPALEIFQ